MGGWLGRNTLGRIPGRVGEAVKYNVGGLFNAPIEALKNTSWENLLNPGALKGEYHRAWANYNMEKSGAVGLEWLEKAASKAKPGAGMVSKIAGTGVVPWIAKRSVLGSLMVGGFTIASAALAARFASNSKHTLDDFQEVVEDLEGRRIPQTDLISHPEKLTPMAQEVRSNLLAQVMPDAVSALGQGMLNQSLALMGGAGASAGAAAGAAVATAKSTGFLGKMLGGAGGGMGMGLMMGGMMLPMAAESIRPNEHFLRSYLDIKDAQNAGQDVAPEAYAELIGAASADARGAGGPKSRLVQQLSLMYQGEGATARDVVIEIAGKTAFEKRLHEAAKVLEAEDRKAKPEVAEEAKPAQKPDAPDMKISAAEAQGRVSEHGRARA
jgi:hypothetical protein